ncbi:replication protein A 70 kDa DNA-binding subunit C [Artemisia annua]|uniref:Replication protein A 70 kDa DNA-binding subunit C n=1 Tax=Artemisia annua TaxID=35608 RepID=A0A2U1K992_ARTAN|nr:replication protein A 70 kDa DNA-binding subunit C [Artemisia annua]
MAVNLTAGAISKLLTNEHTVREPVVQVIDIKCTETRIEVKSNGVLKNKTRYRIVLSDGSVCIGGFISNNINEMIGSNQLQKGSVVQLSNFSSITDNFSSNTTL